MIHFDLPKEQSSIIKVIGVGGGGSNAVNHMYSQNIEGVNFIICNTDAQAIALSKVPNKIQLGPHLTQGLGAGANPNIGRQATEESLEEIKRILEVNTKMAFITAGMGGGTGTGGAPIIAKICKDLNILTVGIVTTPFSYEGKKRLAQAQEGVDLLKKHVDTLLVISNDKLRHQFGNLKMKDAFGKADNVLATAAKCITDVINSTGQINVDFADVCTVMKDGGVAILGSAYAEGDNRAQDAIENALNSPLLNDSEIKGAKWILININSAEGEHEFTMDEVEIIQNHLLAQAGEETDVILGLGYDNTLGSQISVTLIATGFDHKDPFATTASLAKNKQAEKIVLELEIPKQPVVSIPVTTEVIAETKIIEETIVVETESKQTPSTISFDFGDDEKVSDEMMPKLKEEAAEEPTLLQDETVVDDSAPVFFEISSPLDQVSPISFDFNEELTVNKKKETTLENQKSDQLTSGGYLTKPSQIYVEEPTVLNNESQKEVHIKESIDDSALPIFKLVEKEEETIQPVAQEIYVQSIQTSPSVQNALPDEEEELRRRAHERIAKLRNLSYNAAATENSNEFETVPAYLRRNTEIANHIANVETFYSAYTVKSNENNQAEISTINTFLDGKRPD
jgi:cell division protein FtsZ